MMKAAGALARHVRETVWPRRGVAGWTAWLALRPLASLFGAGVSARNLAYQVGLLRAERAPLLVLSVGNLTVGGTGKTPLTLWLAETLAAEGWRPAIVLRGYGGQGDGVTVVSSGQGPQASLEEAGDEAVMLARRFPGVVIASRRRIEGARCAAKIGCNVIVLDDGFQHRALARDFDIVLVDRQRQGLLPAGPNREQPSALRRADAIVVMAGDGDLQPPDVLAGGVDRPIFRGRVKARALVTSDGGQWRQRPLAELGGRRVAAVAGIASPGRFYSLLQQWEAQLEEILEYPDHHGYTAADWQEISRRTRSVDMIVTTEKDLVRLEGFPFARGKLVALRIGAEVERSGELLALILARARAVAENGGARLLVSGS